MTDFFIKVCGITKQSDASLLEDLDFTALGFIFAPSSPRFISPKQASNIKTHKLQRIGVFTQDHPEEILDLANIARLDYLQLHGGQSLETCSKIGFEKVIKVFWIEKYSNTKDFLKDLEKFSAVKYFLFESGQQGGGSGKIFNWEILSDLNIPRPWILAGGLNLDNIIDALKISSKNLFGFDINSGVECIKGVKDKDKILKLSKLLKKKEKDYA